MRLTTSLSQLRMQTVMSPDGGLAAASRAGHDSYERPGDVTLSSPRWTAVTPARRTTCWPVLTAARWRRPGRPTPRRSTSPPMTTAGARSSGPTWQPARSPGSQPTTGPTTTSARRRTGAPCTRCAQPSMSRPRRSGSTLRLLAASRRRWQRRAARPRGPAPWKRYRPPRQTAQPSGPGWCCRTGDQARALPGQFAAPARGQRRHPDADYSRGQREPGAGRRGGAAVVAPDRPGQRPEVLLLPRREPLDTQAGGCAGLIRDDLRLPRRACARRAMAPARAALLRRREAARAGSMAG